MSGQQVEDILALFGERVNHEHVLIANRMSWLMALNGFLLAALGVSIANSHNIPQASLTLIVIGVACLGAVSNASCLFSNYWGSRAISETAIALHQVLNAPENRALLNRSWSTLRLYGSDPDNLPLPSSFWRPPSKFLHPWHLLPIIFGAAYLLVPISGINHIVSSHSGTGISQTSNVLLSLIPILLTALLFIPPILIEQRWRRHARDLRHADRAWAGALPDHDEYRTQILPYITKLTSKEIAILLKCSRDQAKAILDGNFVPHERHWDRLKAALDDSSDASAVNRE
jgi:hypothetical protein